GLTVGPAIAAESKKDDKHVLGLHEYVQIPELEVTLKAKMDTGATTSALSAGDIERFEKNGDPWVRFRILADGQGKRVYELPVVRTSRIKRRVEDYDPEDESSHSKRP